MTTIRPMLNTTFVLRVVSGLIVFLGFTPGLDATVVEMRTGDAADAAVTGDEDAGELAELLEPIRAKHDVPALAGAIIIGGELQAIGAVGVRRAGEQTRLTTNDLFHIGSCAKAMTATLVAMFVEDGTLEWSTTIGEVFDDIDMDERWRDVTIEQLLQHRGGAPDDEQARDLARGVWSLGDDPRKARTALASAVLPRPPGEIGRKRYSNIGYALLGAIVERMADTPWEELMRTRLFEPLGMASAGFGPPGTVGRDLPPDQPRGHRPGGLPVEPVPLADNHPALAPAGTVHCSLADWAAFIALHLGHAGGEERLISKATLARMHAPTGPGEESYAMGWVVTTRPWARLGEEGSGTVLTHAGSNTLWYAVAWLAPQRDLAVLIVTNQGDDRAVRACDDAAGALIRFARVKADESVD